MQLAYQIGERFSPFESVSLLLFGFYLLLLPLLLLRIVPPPEIGVAAEFFGVNVAMILLLIRGLPAEKRDAHAGWIRLAMASFIYISMKLLLFVIAGISSGPELWRIHFLHFFPFGEQSKSVAERDCTRPSNEFAEVVSLEIKKRQKELPTCGRSNLAGRSRQ